MSTNTSSSMLNVPLSEWIVKPIPKSSNTNTTPQSKPKTENPRRFLKSRTAKAKAMERATVDEEEVEEGVNVTTEEVIFAKKTKSTKKRKRSKAEKDHFDTSQYRCSLMAVIKVLSKIKKGKGFSTAQLEYTEHCPFQIFLYIMYEGFINMKECRKSSNVLDFIIETFSVEDETFKIGQKSLRILSEDVSLIFDLPLIGKNIFPVPKMSFQMIPDNCKDFVLRNFGKVEHITKDGTLKRINYVFQSTIYKYESDLPKLIIILAMIIFFFPDNQRYLPWGYVQYIVDDQKVFDISWPLTIRSYLLRSLKVFKSKPRHIPGCRKGGITIVKSMLEAILFNQFIDGQVIDWFVEKQELYDHNYIFSTIMMNAIVYDLHKVTQDIVESFIEDIILNENTESIFFPLHYVNHWSLLKLDYVTLEWEHYDSNRGYRPRTRSTKASNPSYSHALNMRKKIESLFRKKWMQNRIMNKNFGRKGVKQPPCP